MIFPFLPFCLFRKKDSCHGGKIKNKKGEDEWKEKLYAHHGGARPSGYLVEKEKSSLHTKKGGKRSNRPMTSILPKKVN